MKTIDGTGRLSSQPPSVTSRDGYIVGQAMPDRLSPRVAALLKKTKAARGRLIFALDATASREPTWDMAAQLQAAMFEEAAKIGGLDVQLVYYRGRRGPAIAVALRSPTSSSAG